MAPVGEYLDDTCKMLSEFHQFANLPTELRLKIWKHALQPISLSRPRAHFFSVTNYKEDGDTLKKLRVQCHLGSDCEINHGTTYCLAAPKFGDSHSWTNNNPSAYLLDYGMWNACHESREVIEKHYKMIHWTAKFRQGRSSVDDNLPMDACVPFIYPHSSGNWCFAIHPNQDLVCLQPVNAGTVGYYRENPYFIEDFCMVDYMTGMRGFPNLALEYDPSWCDGLDEIRNPNVLFEEMSPRGLFVRIIVWMVENHSRNETLYLIDYNLKRARTEDSHALSNKRKVFSSIDQRFVEASPNFRDYSDTWSRSALEFVDNIDILFGGTNPTHSCLGHGFGSDEFGCNGCDSWGKWSWYSIWDHVGVLECEKAE